MAPEGLPSSLFPLPSSLFPLPSSLFAYAHERLSHIDDMKKDDFTTMVLNALLRFEPALSRIGARILAETVSNAAMRPEGYPSASLT